MPKRNKWSSIDGLYDNLNSKFLKFVPQQLGKKYGYFSSSVSFGRMEYPMVMFMLWSNIMDKSRGVFLASEGIIRGRK